MLTELLLIGHFEDVDQLVPLAVGGLGLAGCGWVALAARLTALRALQFAMLLYVGAGIIGITLHAKANLASERERDPTLNGLALFWSMTKVTAPPALSPGLLVQLGLLGLVYTYKHPALREDWPPEL